MCEDTKLYGGKEVTPDGSLNSQQQINKEVNITNSIFS